MSDRWVPVAAVDSAVEAAMVKNMLEEAGIEVMLGNENAVAMFGTPLGALGGIRVLVSKADEKEAQWILAQRESKADKPVEHEPAEEGPPEAIRAGRPRRLATHADEDEEAPPTPREQDARRAMIAA